MLGVFPLSDHLLSRYSNQASESSILMNWTLLDVVELDVIIHSIVQVLGQGLGPVVVVLTSVVEVVALMVLMCLSQIHLARKVLVVQKVHLLFLEASEISEG